MSENITTTAVIAAQWTDTLQSSEMRPRYVGRTERHCIRNAHADSRSGIHVEYASSMKKVQMHTAA